MLLVFKTSGSSSAAQGFMNPVTIKVDIYSVESAF